MQPTCPRGDEGIVPVGSAAQRRICFEVVIAHLGATQVKTVRSELLITPAY